MPNYIKQSDPSKYIENTSLYIRLHVCVCFCFYSIEVIIQESSKPLELNENIQKRSAKENELKFYIMLKITEVLNGHFLPSTQQHNKHILSTTIFNKQ